MKKFISMFSALMFGGLLFMDVSAMDYKFKIQPNQITNDNAEEAFEERAKVMEDLQISGGELGAFWAELHQTSWWSGGRLRSGYKKDVGDLLRRMEAKISEALAAKGPIHPTTGPQKKDNETAFNDKEGPTPTTTTTSSQQSNPVLDPEEDKAIKTVSFLEELKRVAAERAKRGEKAAKEGDQRRKDSEERAKQDQAKERDAIYKSVEERKKALNNGNS